MVNRDYGVRARRISMVSPGFNADLIVSANPSGLCPPSAPIISTTRLAAAISLMSTSRSSPRRAVRRAFYLIQQDADVAQEMKGHLRTRRVIRQRQHVPGRIIAIDELDDARDERRALALTL